MGLVTFNLMGRIILFSTNEAELKSTYERFGTCLLILLLPFFAASNFVRAETSAMAVASDGSHGWATSNNQQEANRAALEGCNGIDPQHNKCEIRLDRAVVRADGGGRFDYSRSQLSLADAKKIAIKGCGNASCKVTLAITKPGFYSLAQSEVAANGSRNFHLAYQFTNKVEADKAAIQGCEKAEGRKCRVLWVGAIPGTIEAGNPTSTNTVQPATQVRQIATTCDQQVQLNKAMRPTPTFVNPSAGPSPLDDYFYGGKGQCQ